MMQTISANKAEHEMNELCITLILRPDSRYDLWHLSLWQYHMVCF